MTIRRATTEDYEIVAELWRHLDHELPPPIHEAPTDEEKELAEVAEILGSHLAFLAEDDDGTPIGFALVRRRSATVATLTDLYVVGEARRRGVATALVRQAVAELAEGGIEHVDLDVQASNSVARSLYGRWGFRDEAVVMAARISALQEHLGRQQVGSFGSIHVQSDDLSAVEAAVRTFVPRLPGGSRGSLISPPRNGWVTVYDDVCDRDPEMLRRLAREISDRMGCVVLLLGIEQEELLRLVLLDRGRIVDEYLSVPEYHGPLPPGDVVGLAANPTVIHRLTGADPEEIRRVARTAPAPADLPPARELLVELAAALRIEGSEHGWSDAPDLTGMVRIDR